VYLCKYPFSYLLVVVPVIAGVVVVLHRVVVMVVVVVVEAHLKSVFEMDFILYSMFG
jgi:hypothetical protein